MGELLLEGRVSWRSERSARNATLALGPTTLGPARICIARRLASFLRFAVAATLVAALVAAVAAAVAVILGTRWAERRREQGLDGPAEIVRERARQAKEWIDARRAPKGDDGLY